ncbi:hypothetical protein WA556_005827, partial [Blastocystis sp. ATCC 50177/Nand II]
MPLKILQHKKWHVWNQDNVERYMKDESEFMEKVENEEKQERMALMEKRIQQMKEQNGLPTEDAASSHYKPDFNADSGKEGVVTFSPNKEYEEEKFQNQLKEIQQCNKAPIWKLKPTELPHVPWYAQANAVERGRDGKPLDEGELERRKKRDDAMKILEDPLSLIRKSEQELAQHSSYTSEMLHTTIATNEEERETLKSRMLQQPNDIQIPAGSHRERSSHSHHRHHHHKHRRHGNGIVTAIEDSEAYQAKQRKEQ